MEEGAAFGEHAGMTYHGEPRPKSKAKPTKKAEEKTDQQKLATAILINYDQIINDDGSISLPRCQIEFEGSTTWVFFTCIHFDDSMSLPWFID